MHAYIPPLHHIIITHAHTTQLHKAPSVAFSFFFFYSFFLKKKEQGAYLRLQLKVYKVHGRACPLCKYSTKWEKKVNTLIHRFHKIPTKMYSHLHVQTSSRASGRARKSPDKRLGPNSTREIGFPRMGSCWIFMILGCEIWARA